MWVDSMPVLASLVLALDLLQASPSGYAVEDILDLPGSDVAITIARKQPALRAASQQLCYGPDDLGEKDHSARLLELGIESWDVKVAFAEVYVLRPDLGHFTYTQACSGQEEKDTSLSVVFGGLNYIHPTSNF